MPKTISTSDNSPIPAAGGGTPSPKRAGGKLPTAGRGGIHQCVVENKRFGYQGDSGAYADRYEILKDFSRQNRSNPTLAEMALWQMMSCDRLGTRFRRQHIIGDYIVDFVSLRYHLIIELDGKYHNRPDQQYEDAIRERFLIGCGFRILRFTNEEVYESPEVVAARIKEVLYDNH